MKNQLKYFTLFAIFLFSLSPIAFAEENKIISFEKTEDIKQTNSINFDDLIISDLSIKDLGNLKPMSVEIMDWEFQGPGVSQYNPENLNMQNGEFLIHLFSGSATYSYNLKIPKGINNLQPKISLNYNHHAVNEASEIGSGWSLTKSFIFRDIQHTRSDTSDDIFYLNLNGVTMKLIYVLDEDLYHTEQESYLYIKKIDDKWLIKSKDGTTYKFGYNDNTKLESTLESFTSMWFLDEIEDTHGNKITYSYLKNPSSDQAIYLDEINYNIYSIKFDYRGNGPYLYGYLYGTKLVKSKELKEINILNNKDVKYVRHYYLSYSGYSNQRALNEIKLNEEGFYQTTEFSYYQNDENWHQDDNWKIPSEDYFGDKKDQGVRLFDINGDGLVDIARMKDSNLLQYNLNTGNGWSQTKYESNFLQGGFVDPAGNDKGVRFVDINGDTRTDVIQLVEGDITQKKLLINNGNGWSSEDISNIPSDVSFVRKTENDIPEEINCPSGTVDEGFSCDDYTCTKSCGIYTCGNTWELVWDDGDGYTNYEDNSYTCDETSEHFHFCGSRVDWGDFSCSEPQNYCYQMAHFSAGDFTSDSAVIKLDSYNTGQLSSECYDEGPAAVQANSFCLPSHMDCSSFGLEACRNDCWTESLNGQTLTETRIRYPSRKDCDDEYDEQKAGLACAAALAVYVAPVEKSDTYEMEYSKYKYRDNGYRFVDVNGDGKSDIIKGTDTERKTLIQTENGWQEDPNWQIPVEAFFVDQDGYDKGVRILDVNKDNLLDLVKAEDGTRITWLNNGYGWVEDDNWKSVVDFVVNKQNQGIVLVDINGDGLPDIVPKTESQSTRNIQMNDGLGWTTSNFEINNEFDFKDYSETLTDVNGDGLPDIVKAANQNEIKTLINNYAKQNLLKEVKNQLGGKTTIDYKKITSLDNKGDDAIPDLSFNGWVVSSITHDNGMENEHHLESTFTYDYSGGLYDSEKEEFRGFSFVEETNPLGTKIKHWFHQDNARKGLEYKTEVLDEENIIKLIENSFSSIFNDNYYIIKFDSAKESLFDGSSGNPKITQTSFEYDNYGNMNKIEFEGDLSKSRDEKYNYVEYEYDLNKWILSNPKKISIFDYDDSTKLSEIYYKYNSFGDLINEEHWLEDDENPEINYTYDLYGNVKTENDPNNNIITYIYDSTNTYIEKEINPLNHETIYEIDTETGNILSITDPNGYKTEYMYDVFGRMLREISPYDSSSNPTISYWYDFDQNAPEVIQKYQKEEDGKANLESYNYYDGLGNLIQTKNQIDTSDYIAVDYFYDEMGRLKQESNPYSVGNNKGYTEPDLSIFKTSYFYDSMSRPIKIIKPDNTEINVIYDYWDSTVIDEKGASKNYKKDVYGNIVEVKEHVGTGNPIITNELLVFYTPNSFRMDDGCVGDISVAPTEEYELEVCLEDSNSIIQESCKKYVSGIFGTGSNFKTNPVSIPEGDYKLRINWKRIKDPAGHYDYGGKAKDGVKEKCSKFQVAGQAYSDNECNNFIGYKYMDEVWRSPDQAGSSYYLYQNSWDSHEGRIYEGYEITGGTEPYYGSILDINDQACTTEIKSFCGKDVHFNPECLNIGSSTLYINPEETLASSCTDGNPGIYPSNLCTYAGNNIEYTDSFSIDSFVGNKDVSLTQGKINSQGKVSWITKQTIDYPNEEIFTTTYEYDKLGNLLKVIDNDGNKLIYAYDTLGRKTKIKDPDLGNWEYIYDGIGNLIEKTDARGIKTDYVYDKLNRITSQISGSERISYTYDTNLIGTLYSIETDVYTKQFSYDQRLRVTKEDIIYSDGTSFSSEYDYNSMDNILLTGISSDSFSEVINYVYNKGKLESIPNVVTNIEYNELGQPIKRTYANSLVTDITYDDEMHRVKSIKTGSLQDLSYTYDAKGNVETVTDADQGNTKTYTYDWLDRLKTATSTGNNAYDFIYTYDPIGNILSVNKDGQEITFNYDGSPVVHSPHSVDGLYQRNAPIPKLEIVPQVSQFKPQQKLIIANNPKPSIIVN